MVQIKQIFIKATKKISNIFLQLENRRLLKQINKVYENNPDLGEKSCLMPIEGRFENLSKINGEIKQKDFGTSGLKSFLST